MTVTPISDGIVLDHIQAGKGMDLFRILELEKLPCSVALINNADSVKMGKKDIIKIDQVIDLDFDLIGFIDPGITVNIIRGGKLTKERNLELPERIVGVLHCRNPRCITSVEQELPQVFKLVDREHRVYRCLYCETRAKTEE